MTMDEFKKKFAEIEKEMMEADPENDFLFKQIWRRLTDLMCLTGRHVGQNGDHADPSQ